MTTINSFSAIIPTEMRSSITANHLIGYYDIGIPLHLVKAEILEQVVPDQDKILRPIKMWRELLVAGGAAIVEMDGKPVRYVGEIMDIRHQPTEKSRIYFDFDRVLPPPLRQHGIPGTPVYEDGEAKAYVTQATLSELGGHRWSHKLLVADNLNVERRSGINGRIIGVDDHRVGTDGHVLDEQGRPIGNIYGYKVVHCEPPRPGDSWNSPQPIRQLLHLAA